MSVVRFKTKEEERRVGIIAMLEQALERARGFAGSPAPVGVAIIITYPDGANISWMGDSMLLLGAVSRLDTDINNRMDEHTILE